MALPLGQTTIFTRSARLVGGVGIFGAGGGWRARGRLTPCFFLAMEYAGHFVFCCGDDALGLIQQKILWPLAS